MISTVRSGLQSACAKAPAAQPMNAMAAVAAKTLRMICRNCLLPVLFVAARWRWSMAFPFQVCKICRSCGGPARQFPPTSDRSSEPRRESALSHETIQLAQYAADLRFEDLPAAVVSRAKDCIIDTAAAIIYGNTIPWSGTVVGYAQRMGPGGKSRILGANCPSVQPAMAALANG